MPHINIKQLVLALLFASAPYNAYAACSTSSCESTCATSCTQPSCGDCDGSDVSAFNTSNCCCDIEQCGLATCKTVFLPFSQGDNKAREYSLIRPFQYNEENRKSWHFDVAIEFQQNFKRDDLGAYFFPNGSNTIHVGADQSPAFVSPLDPTVDVANTELLLSPTFDGRLTINPRIRNVIVEPQFFIELDKFLCEGAWIWTKIPIVNTRWFLDCCETDSNTGGQFLTLIAPGSPAAPGGPITHEYNGYTAFNAAPAFGLDDQIQQAFGGVLTTGDRKNPLSSGKIICCETNATGIADLPLEIGYNCIQKENGYFGAYLRVVFPTGKIKNRQSLFDPTIGYKRWQLGAGIDFGFDLWKSDESSVRLIADGHYTHIFKTGQCRLFDLAANGCFSRYLLMFQGLQTVPNPAVPKTTQISYTGDIVAFADAFNVCIQSGFDWNFDGIVFLQGQHKGFTGDIGYEVKARSRENISFKSASALICSPCDGDCGGCNCCCNTVPNLQYAIKGPLQTPIPNTNLANDFSTSGATISNATGGQTEALATDSPTVFINAGNVGSFLNYCSGTIPSALSHKVWGDLGYRWEDQEYPCYIGAGAEGEFGHSNKALSLWGVWVKGGVSYN